MKDSFKTIIVLDTKEVAWIDKQIMGIRNEGWRRANRSSFIRSLIRALMEKNIDLKSVANEDELTNLFISNG